MVSFFFCFQINGPWFFPTFTKVVLWLLFFPPVSSTIYIYFLFSWDYETGGHSDFLPSQKTLSARGGYTLFAEHTIFPNY